MFLRNISGQNISIISSINMLKLRFRSKETLISRYVTFLWSA